MLKNLFDKVIDPSLKPISGSDAAFLYSESPKSPMHIGMLTMVEGSIAFDDFKNSVASKLHFIPKFRQRLVQVPFNLDFPYWADDPNFDIDLHIQRIKLPDPADWETLRELTASIFSSRLDLRRPAWSITFIEGLDNVSQVPKGSVAVLAKAHHVMVDGMSGVGVMGVLFSFTPDEKPTKPVPFKPKPLPNELSLLAKSGIGFLQNPLRVPKIASQTMFKVAQNQILNKMIPKNDLVTSSFTVPRTIFNGSISPVRSWGTAILSLDRIKALKVAMEVTINDIILAICAGGIRKYLLEKDKLPSQPLVANVPISVRDKGDDGELGNQISNMLIPIGTHIENPIERLEAIQEQTIRGKVKHKALGAKTLSKMADAVPFGLANLAAGVYTRYNLNEWHRPPFNVTISNVPGPQIPLYLNGNKVSSILGLTPVLDGLGLIIAVFSYNGEVSITTTSDTKTMPDADQFSRYIRESANELEAIIIGKAAELKKKKKKTFQSTPFFTKLSKSLKESQKITSKHRGLYEIELTSSDSGVENWQIDLTGQKPLVSKADSKKKSNASITIDDQYLLQIHKGNLTWDETLIQGRISLEGNEKYKKAIIEILKQH